MELKAFDSKATLTRVAQLDANRQLGFGALCAERLLPNYRAFNRESGWGDASPVRAALDFVWRRVFGDAVNQDELRRHVALCEAAAPESGEHASLFATAAQDACFSVCCLLDFMQQNDVGKIVQVATYATDSVDLYVQEIEQMDPADPELESRILNHPLMQRELQQQELDLREIERASSVEPTFWRERLSSWGQGGRSNLGIE